MGFRTFIDANILVRGRWWDVLRSLADVAFFEPLWSPLALEEVGRHLPQSMRPSDRAFLFTTMNEAFPEALVQWPGAVDVTVRLQVNEKDRHIVTPVL